MPRPTTADRSVPVGTSRTPHLPHLPAPAPDRTHPHLCSHPPHLIGSQNVVLTTNRFGPGAVTERNMSPTPT